MDPFICREFYHAHVKEMSTQEEQHSDQDKCRENHIPDKVHPMDALTATEPGVFVIDIKTIPALFISPTNRGKVINNFQSMGSYPLEPQIRIV